MRQLFCIFLALCLLLAGCSPAGDSYVPTGDALHQDGTTAPTGNNTGAEQQMKLAYYEELGLDPYTVANYTNRMLFGLLYQGLFAVDRDYNVEPILCKSYQVSKDMKTYVFYLEAATFADGTPLTAQDVVASLEYARNTTVYWGRLSCITQLSVTADGGVRIDLSSGYSELPLLLDVPIVKEAELGEPYPTGTGAYRISSGISGRGLLRTDKWWCNGSLKVTATYIPLVACKDNEEIRNAFELEGVGLVCTDPSSGAYIDYRGDYEIWECQTGVFVYLACNEESDVFSIPEIRQALTYAINRSYLTEEYYQGFAVGTVLPAIPGSPYYNEGLASRYTYDPQKLKDAIANANLEDNRISILVHKRDSTRSRAARAIGDMLTECGLKVEVKVLDGSQYENAMYWDYYDLYLGQTMLSPNMDLSAFYDGTSTLSRAGLADAAILALCKNAMANIGNYQSLHRAVLNDAMLCPILFSSYAVYGQRGLLSEVEPARDNVLYYSLGKTLADALIPEVFDNSSTAE